ncbi:MFS transporter [Barnesiella intestinihominis]|uniref:MFS transporter n=1 Tax=Barnesiella intestinihominis TaxID=487174 RepID=UPI0032C0F404
MKKNYKWIIFLITTLGYSLFYVCRLSINVVKKPIVDSGYLTETELGIIGSALFFSYAIGKFVNGFLADRFNIRFLMGGALLIAAILNFTLGFHVLFGVFVVLWGINGWVQSLGGPCSAIALNRWFGDKQRGTVYGFWSASHNIGEAFTFIFIASIVSFAGWQYGFINAGILGIIGAVLIFIFLRPYPQNTTDNIAPVNQKEVGKNQLEVLKNSSIWLVAFASAFMYISRYAVNSWGVYYFEAEKHYSIIEASTLISVSSVCGIIGTVFSGLLSDKLFKGHRYAPACIASAINLIALCLFLFIPDSDGSKIIDITAMVLFGISIGILICYLGGLMAIDLAPKSATGAAVGVIGIASYIAAGIQDIVSGFFIESKKQIIDGIEVIDFSFIRMFWVLSALASLLLLLFIYYKHHKRAY